MNQHGPKLTDPGCILCMYFSELRLKSCRNILPQCLCVNVIGIYFGNASTGLARKQCRPPATYTCFFWARQNNMLLKIMLPQKNLLQHNHSKISIPSPNIVFWNPSGVTTQRPAKYLMRSVQQVLISSLPLYCNVTKIYFAKFKTGIGYFGIYQLKSSNLDIRKESVVQTVDLKTKKVPGDFSG